MQVLGVASDADDVTIKKAKRALALATHPDKTSVPGAKEAFQMITDASETLLDSTIRSEYDRDLNAYNAAGASGSDFDPEEADASDGSYFYIMCGCGSYFYIMRLLFERVSISYNEI